MAGVALVRDVLRASTESSESESESGMNLRRDRDAERCKRDANICDISPVSSVLLRADEPVLLLLLRRVGGAEAVKVGESMTFGAAAVIRGDEEIRGEMSGSLDEDVLLS
jgi:hypothetical protein